MYGENNPVASQFWREDLVVSRRICSFKKDIKECSGKRCLISLRCSFLKNQRFSVSCNVRLVISDCTSSMTNKIADDYQLTCKQYMLQTVFDMPVLSDERAELQVEISSAPIFTRVRAELSLFQLPSSVMQIIGAPAGSSIEASPSSDLSDTMEGENDEQQDEQLGTSPSKTFLGFLGMRPGKHRIGQYENSMQEQPTISAEDDMKDSSLDCVSPESFNASYRSWFRPKVREMDQDVQSHSMSSDFTEDILCHETENMQAASASVEKHSTTVSSPVGDNMVAERRGWWWERKHKQEIDLDGSGGRMDSPDKQTSGEAQQVASVWKEESRVPALGLKGDFTLREPGRYKFSAKTLANRFVPNRAMGYVMTISSARPGVTLEIGAPEFIQTEEFFHLIPEDIPVRVSWTLWSHAIFKTSAASAQLEVVSPQQYSSLYKSADWLVLSKGGGCREEEYARSMVKKGIDQELQILLSHIHTRETVQMVLVLLALLLVSCTNEVVSNPIFHIPTLWSTCIDISIRGILIALSFAWCIMHPENVSEQIATWHRDWLNYRRVKKLNQRARDLSQRMKHKGIWGKVKLVHR
uniref:Uncharacterized protein n=1 Tax=Guillardia theta TaxID=55529 RepID=A0A7S4NFR7_GUITH|mmetsp:Transcript_21471/g.71140  ORF Transcript_21471/g.71140 Transcript_21471/m.71140 type:complete len:582 (+) Transcript_21471:69-1814(+)